MPLYDWSTQAAWDAAYDNPGEPDGHSAGRPEVRLHYHRAAMMPYVTTLASELRTALGWGPTSRVVIVGAGFGWTSEVLVGMGLQKVVAIDTSPFVQANKFTTETQEIRGYIAAAGLDPDTGRGAEVLGRSTDGLPRTRGPDVLNENVALPAARARVRQAMGGQANFEVLTESMLESFTDDECRTISSALHALTSGRVTHYVFPVDPGNRLPLNWKSLEQWKTLLPSDTFVEAGTYRVI